MNLRRNLSILVVFLMLSGSVPSPEPETCLQVRQSDLGPLIRGNRVALRLVEGARLESRIQKVTNDALVVRVKNSSQLAAYPKGKMQISRAAVSRIEARDLNENVAAKRVKQTALTVGATLGPFWGPNGLGARSTADGLSARWTEPAGRTPTWRAGGTADGLSANTEGELRRTSM